jgi:hypothetical protein
MSEEDSMMSIPIWFFHAKPDRGATRPYVPAGNAIDISVGTIALPRAGTITSFDDDKSYPAAPADARLGATAVGDNLYHHTTKGSTLLLGVVKARVTMLTI